MKIKTKESKPFVSEKLLKKITREEESKRLLFNTEAEIPDEHDEYNRRIKSEKIKLQSGIETSVSEIEGLLADIIQPYAPIFTNDKPLYKEIYRLNGWSHLDPTSYIKPSCVAGWTIELFYDRFSKDLSEVLEVKNPFVSGCIRRHKHFQFLNEHAQERLCEFIDDAISLMKKCKTWYEFRVKYGVLYGLPVQVRMFETFQEG